MSDDSTLEQSIDPLTGTTYLADGADVYVKDDRGRTHRGTIVSIGSGDDARYTVLLSCRGRDRELVVTEQNLLARASSEWDI